MDFHFQTSFLHDDDDDVHLYVRKVSFQSFIHTTYFYPSQVYIYLSIN